MTEVIGDISDSLEKIGNRCHRTKEPEQALAIKRQMSKEHEQYENDMAYPVQSQRRCYIRKERYLLLQVMVVS